MLARSASLVGGGVDVLIRAIAIAFMVAVGLTWGGPFLARLGATAVTMKVTSSCRTDAAPENQRLIRPTALAAAGPDSVVLADLGRRVIERRQIGTCAVIASAPLAQLGLGEVHAIASGTGGNVVALDSSQASALVLAPALQVVQRISFQGGQLFAPAGIALAPDGSILVANTGGGTIVRYAPDGRLIRVIGGRGSEPGQLREPRGLIATADTFFVADSGNGRVQQFTYDGKLVGTWPISVGVMNVDITDSGSVIALGGSNGRLLALAAGSRAFVPVTAPSGDLLSISGARVHASAKGDRIIVAAPGVLTTAQVVAAR